MATSLGLISYYVIKEKRKYNGTNKSHVSLGTIKNYPLFILLLLVLGVWGSVVVKALRY